jgi:hypothetical protein
MSWRLFFALTAAGMVGAVAVIPFLRAVASVGAAASGESPPPGRALTLAVLIQSAVLLSVTVAAGLWLSQRVGLRVWPLDPGHGAAAGGGLRALLAPALLGMLTAAALIALDALLFARTLPRSFRPLLELPLWKRLAGVLYGGITEELISRLFVMSLLVWLIAHAWRTPAGGPAPGAYWCALAGAALAFAALHLPATMALAPLTPKLIARGLLLNGAAGAVFGYLYWRRGLVAAMAAHMGADLILLGPGFALVRALMDRAQVPSAA